MPNVEMDTNQLYRKKYFLDSAKILTGVRTSTTLRANPLSQVIDSTRVVVSKQAVPVRSATATDGDRIRVDVVRDGNRIKGLRVACPCGRHTELDVEYGPQIGS
jgi:hypothetical protein